MSIWALIPAKDPAIGKTRLSNHLSPSARRSLSRFTFERVLHAVRETPEVTNCLVVSQSAEILDYAARMGAIALPEAPSQYQPDPTFSLDTALNAAIGQGAAEAIARGATSLLVVAGDLPLAGARVLGELLRLLPDDGMAIVPDRHGHGTNVLYARPPNAIPFEFGSGSFERHYELASSRGLRVVVSRAPELTLDIDTPEDLDLLAVLVGSGSPSRDGDLGLVADMLDQLTDHPAPMCASSQCR